MRNSFEPGHVLVGKKGHSYEGRIRIIRSVEDYRSSTGDQIVRCFELKHHHGDSFVYADPSQVGEAVEESAYDIVGFSPLHHGLCKKIVTLPANLEKAIDKADLGCKTQGVKEIFRTFLATHVIQEVLKK